MAGSWQALAGPQDRFRPELALCGKGKQKGFIGEGIVQQPALECPVGGVSAQVVKTQAGEGQKMRQPIIVGQKKT